MERVALKKQKILEEKQLKARKFMTPRNPRAQSYKVECGWTNYEAENGWKQTPSGWVKKFEPLLAVKSYQNLPQRLRSKTPKKISKEDIELKMTKASLKRQQILEDKKEIAKKLRSQSQKQDFQVLSDLSN